MTQKALEARALIAGDLFQDGEITRVECFRLEMDAALGQDTSDIQYHKNQLKIFKLRVWQDQQYGMTR